MFRIMVMNGLLISLILIWTSAAKEPSAGYLIKSSTKPPTGPLNYSVSKPMVSLHETNMEIRSRKTLCSRELGGRCVSKKKSCPSNLPYQKSPGKPYCSKKNHCCYPGSIIEIEDLLFQKSEKDDDVNWGAIQNACVKGNNHKIYEQVTIDICKEKCIEEDEINCQSIEYSSAQQMCAISEARSDSDDFIEPCFVDGWVFAEREFNAVKCIDVKGQKRCEYWEKNFQYCSKGKYIDYMAFYCKNTCLKCEDKCIDVKGQKRCEYWEKNFNYCSQGKYIDYMTIYCTKTCLKCEDKKECEINNGGCDHICTDTIGSHICTCQEGYSLDDDQITCIDNKECEVNNGGCDHICTDTIGSYICSCQEGYNLDDDQITCIDTKECEVNNGGCGHICTDTIGSHICSCQEGYTLDDDRKACIDTKECEVNNGGCDHICTDTIGSYICSCQEGYTLDDDRKACIDVNWSAIRNACVKGNNYKIYEEVTIDICKEKCVEEVDINCQSIEYSSAQQMCAISEVRSDSDDFIEPCFVDGWVFAEREFNAGSTTDAPTTTAPGNTTTNGSTTGAPTTTAPGNTTTNGTTTGAPTTTAPSNTTTNGPTTGAPTTTAPGNTTTNVTSCNLVWKYEEDRPLIMIWGGQTVVPPITDIDISNDPNRFPEKNYLIFACPGENNIFKHVDGNHTKLHGECISHDQFQVCVNNYSEIMDLSNLSCRSKMHPSIIKQVNDTSYKKSCEDIGGELYKIGYIYGDKKEFKDLDTKVCFSEKDQTTLWTSTNIDKIEISSSTRYEDPTNFRTARGFAMKAFYSQKSQHELLKEVLDKEATSVWNDKACRNHGGHCVRGGKPCPKHLPHQTSQGEPFCSSFYRCCYSEQCDPTTCTYKGKKGKCSLDSLPGTTGVGSQECKKGCQCYIKDNKTLRQFESLQERMGNGEPKPKPSVKKRCDGEESCDPTTCTYAAEIGICGLNSWPGTTEVGIQECKEGCKCYIKGCNVNSDTAAALLELGSRSILAHAPRIWNGKKAGLKQFPWQVNVKNIISIKGNVLEVYLCGGSIISKKWVLSAAHCFVEATSNEYKWRAEMITITAGVLEIDDKGGQTNTYFPSCFEKYIMINEQYKSITNKKIPFDIAVIKLKNELLLNDNVNIINLANKFEVESDITLFVSGWGSFQLAEGYTKPQDNIWGDECRIVGDHAEQQVDWCMNQCDITPWCNVFNYKDFPDAQCILRACVTPIPKPTGYDSSYMGFSLEPEPTSDILRWGSVTTIETDSCKQLLASLIFPTSDIAFCTRDKALEKEYGTLSGDSGGPVVDERSMTPIQVGVISQGTLLKDKKSMLSVFMNVAKFREWIDKTMQENCKDKGWWKPWNILKNCKKQADKPGCGDTEVLIHCEKTCKQCEKATWS